MAEVETARGPMDTKDLGRVLMHEHVFVLSIEIQQNYPEEWGDEDSRVSDAIRRLTELKEAGIDTILDPTAIGLGRYIPRIKTIAEHVDLNIIVATGLYTFNELPHYYANRPVENGVDPMTVHFVRDIEQGIADTGIRAGVIKCATDRFGVTPDVERTLRACAQAHRQTGCPITTHTSAAEQVGLDQQRIFKEEGIDLTRVVIGHCGARTTRTSCKGCWTREHPRHGPLRYRCLLSTRSGWPRLSNCAAPAPRASGAEPRRLLLSRLIGGETPLSGIPRSHSLHVGQDVSSTLPRGQRRRAPGSTPCFEVDVPKQLFETRALGPY